MYRIFLIFCFLLIAASPVAAADPCATQPDPVCIYDPRPAADDFALPMPGGMKMVFRKVSVPGSEFWGNPERVVKVGDIQGSVGDDAIFESVQHLPVAGAFFDGNNWFYYLGKYEVTVGQYVMVMGEGDLAKGLEVFYTRSGDKKFSSDLKKAASGGREVKRTRLLARPLAWLSWFDYQAFVQHYNRWCFADDACMKVLPRLPERLTAGSDPAATPGFLRLPTELEWEYAARGGHAAKQQLQSGSPVYEATLPFPAAQLKAYAWAKANSRGKGTTRIGRLKPSYGFYDLFGNVQELTANLFTAELIQGKVGGLSARGGSYLDYDNRLRVSQRTEMPLYQLEDNAMTEARSPTSGIRLAIGSLVVQSPRYKEDIKNQYETYVQDIRAQTVAGQSNLNQFSRATDLDLRKAQDILTALANSSSGQQATQIHNVSQAIQKAQKTIDNGILDVVEAFTTSALIVLKEAGWHYARADVSRQLIDKIKGMNISGRSAQIAAQQKKLDEAMTGFDNNFGYYVQTVKRLKSYPANVVEKEIADFEGEKRFDRPYVEACQLMRKQLKAPANITAWKQQVEEMALSGVYFQ